MTENAIRSPSNAALLLKRFLVLEFSNRRKTAEIVVVPRNWIIQRGDSLLCQWPINKTETEIESMVENSIPVSVTHCKLYENIKILNQSGSYDKAVRILEALEDESDVSDSEGIGSEAVNILSEPQAPVRRKRTVNRRVDFNYDSDERDDSTPPRSRRPRQALSQSTPLASYPSPPAHPFLDNDLNDLEIPESSNEAQNMTQVEFSESQVLVTGTPVPVALEITNSFEPDDTLSVKKDEWDEMKATIAELKSQSRAALVQKVVAEINPEKPEALPVTCETEMRALEATLANRDDFAYHVSFLHSRAVSLDIKPFLWRVMSNIFDSKFARVVNMNGSYHARVAEGRGKLALKKDFPKILNLIEVTVRLKFKSSELKFIHTTVGQWLQDSISRAGGRRQRSLESELRKRLGEQQNQPATE